MRLSYRTFTIRDWQPIDRTIAVEIIQSVLMEYGLKSEPVGADQDVWQVEDAYWGTGGEFWVIEQEGRVVGTGAYYPIQRGKNAVEIRKMYLLPEARGQGLGQFLLNLLETTIAQRGFEQIWIETSTRLKEAISLYEKSGYEQSTDAVETQRCDRVYVKHLTQPQKGAGLLG